MARGSVIRISFPSGEVECGEDVRVLKTTDGLVQTYSFEFQNGFVIGLYSLRLIPFERDFTAISFKLFGMFESSHYEESFDIVFELTGYGKKTLRGRVYAVQDGEELPIGSFKLSNKCMKYKGLIQPVVCNRVRHAKELLLCGKLCSGGSQNR